MGSSIRRNIILSALLNPKACQRSNPCLCRKVTRSVTSHHRHQIEPMVEAVVWASRLMKTPSTFPLLICQSGLTSLPDPESGERERAVDSSQAAKVIDHVSFHASRCRFKSLLSPLEETKTTSTLCPKRNGTNSKVISTCSDIAGIPSALPRV